MPPPASLFYVSFLCIAKIVSFAVFFESGTALEAFSRFATVLVRRATEPYYVLDWLLIPWCRDCEAVILLRQHVSLNEPFGGGPIDDTCASWTSLTTRSCRLPTSRTTLDICVAPRKMTSR